MGVIEFDLLLGDVHSLKEKRSIVRPFIADVRRRFQISVAEVDHLELHRRAAIGVAVVAAEQGGHLTELLDTIERRSPIIRRSSSCPPGGSSEVVRTGDQWGSEARNVAKSTTTYGRLVTG